MKMTKQISVSLLVLILAAAGSYAYAAQCCQAAEMKGKSTAFNVFPSAGKRAWLNSDYYIVYTFSKKPVIGTVVLKIELFDKQGKKDTSLKIFGDAGMPSMSGAHDSGDVEFKLNKKGDYLLPVNVVMPGDWEVKIKFKKENKVIYNGSVKFDV